MVDVRSASGRQVREHQLLDGRYFDRGRGGLGRPFLFAHRSVSLRLTKAATVAALVVCTFVQGASAAERVAELVLEGLAAQGFGPDALRIIHNAVHDSGQVVPLGFPSAHEAAWQRPEMVLDAPSRVVARVFAAYRWDASPVMTAGGTSRGSETEVVVRFATSVRLPLARWRGALSRLGQDRSALVAALAGGELPNEFVAAGLDVGLDRAVRDLGPPVMALLRGLLAAQDHYDSARVPGVDYVRGSPSSDQHRPVGGGRILVIDDPGGDDTYDFTQVAPGSVIILIDRSGNDRFVGPGGVLSVLVVLDRAGDDEWIAEGGGPSGALGGVAAVADLSGADAYLGGAFGQAAAAMGRAVLLDADGDDSYEIGSLGQAFAGTAGAAVLIDVRGNDRYVAGGAEDSLNRGGGISKAQGVGFGDRRGLAGGVAALIDLDGDDVYTAQLFAQGLGYFYGLGLLHDAGGSDHYTAVRYAQGAGAHFGVGVVVDEAGDDNYDLSVGVGQGMGLDLSIGLLRDRGGDDAYHAQSLAQGANTANGLGVLVDDGGSDRFDLAGSGWGERRWSGGLPGFGALIGADIKDMFYRGAQQVVISDLPRLGPSSTDAAVVERPLAIECVPEQSEARAEFSLGDALETASPVAGDGPRSIAGHWIVRKAIVADIENVLDAVGRNELRGLGLLGPLFCHLTDPADRSDAVQRIVVHLEANRVVQTWPVAGALLRTPLETSERRAVVDALATQPECSGLVAAAEMARRAQGLDDEDSGRSHRIVLSALASRCWRARAVGLRLADALGIAVAPPRHPAFLADRALRSSAFPQP